MIPAISILRPQDITKRYNTQSHESSLGIFDKYYGDSTGKANVLGVDTVGHFKTKSAYTKSLIRKVYRDAAVCISGPNCFRYLFVGLRGQVYKREVDTPDELPARILDPAARVKKCDYEIFADELKSKLGLAVGFANNYCEL